MPSKSVSSSRFSTKNEDERYGRGIENRIGSRPPSCEHKCFGCSPCQPTQVPTISLHYTNYEPEGWKCKCGPSFYSP
ncbi:putative EPIDERMAL PATTERNING FACTOR-like protein [Helianthus debilis subsp. tardiflorus]